jgi:hypothetical protein
MRIPRVKAKPSPDERPVFRWFEVPCESREVAEAEARRLQAADSPDALWIYLQPHGRWVARRIPVNPELFQPAPMAEGKGEPEPMWEKAAGAVVGMALRSLDQLGTF